jgi:hypothetical protein
MFPTWDVSRHCWHKTLGDRPRLNGQKQKAGRPGELPAFATGSGSETVQSNLYRGALSGVNVQRVPYISGDAEAIWKPLVWLEPGIAPGS